MTLTPREQQIVAGLAAGKTAKEIGAYPLEVLRMRKKYGYRTTTQMVCEMKQLLQPRTAGNSVSIPST